MSCVYHVDNEQQKELASKFISWESDEKAVSKFYNSLNESQKTFLQNFQELAMKEIGSNREGTIAFYKLYFLDFTKHPHDVPGATEADIRSKYDISQDTPLSFHDYLCYITDLRPRFGSKPFTERLPIYLANSYPMFFLCLELMIFCTCIVKDIIFVSQKILAYDVLTHVDIIRMILYTIIIIMCIPVTLSTIIAIYWKLKGYGKTWKMSF